MVQSAAKTVDAYLKEADAARRPALVQLRKLCREILSGCDEEMDYGMATYKKGGEMVTAFANQKGYIAFYAGSAATAKHKKELAGTDCGKGCIRYKKQEQIDFNVVRAILTDLRAGRKTAKT